MREERTKKGRNRWGYDLFSVNKLPVELRRCGVAGRKARVGQRCALPWNRLGPIQKFGPPDGIVTVKFDSDLHLISRRINVSLGNFSYRLLQSSNRKRSRTLHGNCTPRNRGLRRFFVTANFVPKEILSSSHGGDFLLDKTPHLPGVHPYR